MCRLDPGLLADYRAGILPPMSELLVRSHLTSCRGCVHSPAPVAGAPADDRAIRTDDQQPGGDGSPRRGGRPR